MRSRHRRLRFESLEPRHLLAAVQIATEIVGHPGGGHPGSHVTVPVEIDDATGVRAAEIRIKYDTKQLDVEPKDISAGVAWAGKGVAISNVDEPAGAIVVFVFAAENLERGSGSLIDVSFTIRKDARGTKAVIDLAEVRLNEGQIQPTAIPVSGADTTDGSITIKRDSILQQDNASRERSSRVCVVESQVGRQELVVGPLPQIAPTHSLRSTPKDKPAWHRRDSRFIGPSADLLFATTNRWLLVQN